MPEYWDAKEFVVLMLSGERNLPDMLMKVQRCWHDVPIHLSSRELRRMIVALLFAIGARISGALTTGARRGDATGPIWGLHHLGHAAYHRPPERRPEQFHPR
jgi:hypothetical protein